MRSKFDSLDFVQMVWASFFTEREKMAGFTEPNDLIRYLAKMAKNKLYQESRRQLKGQKHNVGRERALIAETAYGAGYSPVQTALRVSAISSAPSASPCALAVPARFGEPLPIWVRH